MENLKVGDQFTITSPRVNGGEPTPVQVTGRAGSQYQVSEFDGDGKWWLAPESFAIEGMGDE